MTEYWPVSRRHELERRCLGSAGPNASISGMKKLYWGKGAHVVKCGRYIYCLGYGKGVI